MAIPISNVPRRVQYSPSGVGPYAFTFEILVNTDLAVYQGTELLTLTADYTVTINPNGTGSVTLTSAATGTITIIGARAIQRTTDFVTGGDFRANTVNDEMDSQTIFSQQLAEELGRGIKIAPYSPTTVNTELPAPIPNGIVAWNSTANAINYISPADIGTAVAYATAYADTFTGNGSQVNFTLSRNPAVLFNLDVSLNGVTQVPGVDYTLSGTTLTMTTPPPNTSVLLAKYKEGLPNYEGDSQDVRFVPAGSGAVTTTVQAKLRETVSANDFGAVGDGTANDIPEIQACLDSQNVAYTSPSWWTKWKTAVINFGNRIALGAYQSAYAGIIQFNALNWPVNATIKFNGGSGERAEHQNSIADDTTPVNEWRYEAPYHPSLVLNQRTAASYAPFTQPAHSLGDPNSMQFASILFQQDSEDQFQFFADLGTNTLQVKTFPPVAGSFLSKVWAIDAETGDQSIQTTSIDTVDDCSLVVGGRMKVRGGSGAINGHETQLEATYFFQNGTSGNKAALQLDDTTGAIEVQRLVGATEGAVLLKFGSASGFLYQHTYSGLPATAAALKLGKNSTTNVSVIVSGAIQINNAGWYSGAGSPEGVVSAAVGSFYSRTDGGAGTTFYVKESGTGNTGWVAK